MTSDSAQPAAIPSDDMTRQLRVVDAQSSDVKHVSMVGNTYTILVSGADTAGRYCLIDMFIPPGGGPPPHRHDFEEMFQLIEGQLEFTFRGNKLTVSAGQTVNIPANAPHSFKNVAKAPARLMCLCVPAGQEGLFVELGDLVATRTAPPPRLSDAEQSERKQKAQRLASRYRTEMLPPW